MQAIFSPRCRVVTGILSLIMLAACNSGVSRQINSNNSSLKSADQAFKHNRDGKIDVTWTIDNLVKPQDLNNSLKDLGWHLVTLSVSSADSSTVPTPVEGLLAEIYPAPPIKRGQRILLQDINCATAVFSQVGDSCSAYFKLDYDSSIGENNPVLFPVKMVPQGKIKTTLNFMASYQPNTSMTDYRAVNSFESQYYSASALASNKNAYQIYLVQNGSTPALEITTLQEPLNPIFKLMHRSSVGNNDPYYGAQTECALNSNPDLRQSSKLAKLNESCILVYNAAATATNAMESDLISVASDSANSFPYWSNRYSLVANYTNGTPLPNSLITEPSATLHEELPFNNFILSYNFTPQPLLPILPGSHSQALILPEGTTIWNGETILSSNGTPTTVTNIVPQFPDGTWLSSDYTSVNACGGTYASAGATAVAYAAITRQGAVQIRLNINSSGHCGSPAPSQFSVNIPLSGYSNTLYHIDDTGCDGGHWDIRAVPLK